MGIFRAIRRWLWRRADAAWWQDRRAYDAAHEKSAGKSPAADVHLCFWRRSLQRRRHALNRQAARVRAAEAWHTLRI